MTRSPSVVVSIFQPRPRYSPDIFIEQNGCHTVPCPANHLFPRKEYPEIAPRISNLRICKPFCSALPREDPSSHAIPAAGRRGKKMPAAHPPLYHHPPAEATGTESAQDEEPYGEPDSDCYNAKVID